VSTTVAIANQITLKVLSEFQAPHVEGPRPGITPGPGAYQFRIPIERQAQEQTWDFADRDYPVQTREPRLVQPAVVLLRGLAYDGTTRVRLSTQLDEDIPSPDVNYPRAGAIRITSPAPGWLQIHPTGVVSRILDPTP
jgi:hypothetical protein